MRAVLLAVAVVAAQSAKLRRSAPAQEEQSLAANGTAPAKGTLPEAFPAALPAFALPGGSAPPWASTGAAAAPIVALPGSAGRRTSQVVARQPRSFQAFYNSYSAGPGIWKWANALAVYDRFLVPMSTMPLKLAEVGVQSGGSIAMWKAVLGPSCRVYGIDINPAVSKFADAVTTITIGDQADAAMWGNFFATQSAGPIDVMIDDGGHEPHQMLVTLTSVFDNLTPGGVIAIEDIHGESYVESFFVPSARFLAAKASWGQLSSVHVFPYMLVAKRAGNDYRAPLAFGGTYEVVREFAELWAAIPRHWGGHVILENPGWGPFLTEQGLGNFFRVFGELHHSVWSDSPAGCQHTAAAVCTVRVSNARMQDIITGVHIFPTRLVVEVAGGPVVLEAVRHGTEWLQY